LTTLQGQYSTNQHLIDSLISAVSTTSAAATTLAGAVAANTAKLQCVSSSTDASNFIVNGCNVQVVNGLGSTDTRNGRGNLVVGRNEDGACSSGACARDGSHNVVLGMYNQYTSFGGMVAGTQNTVSGNYSTITAGTGSKATGAYSTVSGGAFHTVTEEGAAATGGRANRVFAVGAVASGGRATAAGGEFSTVVGGSAATAMNALEVVP